MPSTELLLLPRAVFRGLSSFTQTGLRQLNLLGAHSHSDSHSYICMPEGTHRPHTYTCRIQHCPPILCLAHSRVVMCSSQRVPPASISHFIPIHFKGYLSMPSGGTPMQHVSAETMQSQLSEQMQKLSAASVHSCVLLWCTCLTCPNTRLRPLPNARYEMRSSIFRATAD